MLVPLLTLLIPLFKIIHSTYRWQVRKKSYCWFREVQALDNMSPKAVTAARLEENLGRLDAIEDEVHKVEVLLSDTDECHDMRLNLGLISGRLLAAGAKLAG